MKISIVTTVYNIESYLKECLDSILNSTYKNIELIVVNDCSTDDSMKIVNDYEDDRLVIINHNENMGAGWARRHGIEAATGDYIITIDGDDWISPTFIEDLVNNAKETNADIVSGGITVVYSDEYEEVKKFKPMISTGFKKLQDYGNNKIIFLNNKLVRRSMYDIVPYCTRRFCEDTPVIIPLLYYANMISYVDNQGYFYRQHSQSLCHSVPDFEKILYKALCCKELITFFSDKEEEYTKIINKQEYHDFLKQLKTLGTPELLEKHKTELNNLNSSLFNLVSNQYSEQKNNIELELQTRLNTAISKAENFGFKNNGLDKLVHIIQLNNDDLENLFKLQEQSDYLKNATICIWDETSLDMSHPWVQQTYKQQKYKLAQDYLKLWCIYFYGGIYINSDINIKLPSNLDSEFLVVDLENKQVSLDYIFGANKQNQIIANIAIQYNDFVYDEVNLDYYTQNFYITNLFELNGLDLNNTEFKGLTMYPITQILL